MIAYPPFLYISGYFGSVVSLSKSSLAGWHPLCLFVRAGRRDYICPSSSISLMALFTRRISQIKAPKQMRRPMKRAMQNLTRRAAFASVSSWPKRPCCQPRARAQRIMSGTAMSIHRRSFRLNLSSPWRTVSRSLPSVKRRFPPAQSLQYSAAAISGFLQRKHLGSPGGRIRADPGFL